MKELTLTLDADELAATAEALFETLMRRMKWTLQRDIRNVPDGWGDLDFEVAQRIVNQLTAALAKTMMALRETGELHPEFEQLFTPSEQMWDLIAQVTLAERWAQAPVHGRHPSCAVCTALSEV